MPTLNGTFIALQGGSWWSRAGILVLALVICCLVMMFTMGSMGSKSRNRKDEDAPSKKNESEPPGTKRA